jgi:DNA (cytosine-5)-methyltransferase 1
MKAISLFSGAGIGESRLSELGIEILAGNELISARADIYKQLDKSSQMFVGSILEPEVFDKLLAIAPDELDLLIATPPCQGVSIAGKNRNPSQQSADDRNYLLFPIIKYIRETRPKYVLIENVPQYLDLLLPINGRLDRVVNILKAEFGDGYHVDSRVINCADLGVPQSRKRAFIKLFKKNLEWPWPTFVEQQTVLSEVIFDLPSLESGEKSMHKWHFARNHSDAHVRWMRHTPSGRSAFENPIHFPMNEAGEPIKAYNSTYRRMSWDKPGSAITMRNDAISSQMNVHPGRKRKDGTYSDARVLSPLELMIVNSMNADQWALIDTSEVLVRKVLGEGVPPLAINKILGPLVGSQ